MGKYSVERGKKGTRWEGSRAVNEDEMLMTIGDVAHLFRLKPQTIYRWVQQNKLPGAKIGKEWRFRRSAIERWLDRYMKQQEEAAERDGAGGESAAAGERRAKKRTGKKKAAGLENN